MINTSKALPIGTILRSNSRTYTIVEVLGQGGFGITYRATAVVTVENISIEAQFAIKEHFIDRYCERDKITHFVAYSKPVANEVESSRMDFLSEAKRLRDLSKNQKRHPNIVCVNETFEANNTAYYVMEYLKGESLSDYVKRCGPLTDRKMRITMEPIIDAVAFLHNEFITHLDIKPANIMLTHDDNGRPRPVLIDFGLSRHFDPTTDKPSSSIQQAGFSEGYAPIEQVQAFNHFYPGTDVYSLGATMLFALTGRTPAAAENLDDITLRDSIPAGLSTSTVTAITAAMHHFRKQRPENAAALLAVLTGGDKTRTIGSRTVHDIYPDTKTTVISSPTPRQQLSSIRTGETTQIPTQRPIRRQSPKPNPSPVRIGATTQLYTKRLNHKPRPKQIVVLPTPTSPKKKKTPYIGIVVITLFVILCIVWLTHGFGHFDGAETVKTETTTTNSAYGDTFDSDKTTIDNQAEQKKEDIIENRSNQSVEKTEKQSIYEEETVSVRPHQTAKHLDLAVTYNGGKRGYFSSEEWISLSTSEQSMYRKMGMVVRAKGQRFIVDLKDKDNGRKMDWDEAMEMYGNIMPNYNQGEAIVSIDLNTWVSKMKAYGGDATESFWINEENEPDEAWIVQMSYELIVSYEKTASRKVRAVTTTM